MLQTNCKKYILPLFCCFFFFISLLHPSSSPAADTIIKVFKIHYRFAEDMEKTVELFLSPEGRVVADKNSNSLIVKDYAENIKAVAEFLKEHDTIQQQVLLKIHYSDETSLKEAGVSVNWHYRDKYWTVGTVVGPGTGMNITAFLAARKQKLSVKGEQTLRVMSGRSGRIETGISIPYTDWFYHYSRQHGYLIAETKFRDVTTGFLVTPRVIGENIHISIQPRISFPGATGPDEIIFREAATDITSKNRETIVIGSSSKSDESLVSNIMGRVHAQNREEGFIILLTAETVK